MPPEAETVIEAVVDTQTAELISPDREGSLSDIMEKVKMTGHPAAGPEGEPAEPRQEDSEKVVVAPEAPKFKHATWEETERAREEAERSMHRANEETAVLKKRWEDREAAEAAAAEAVKAEASRVTPEQIRAEAKAKVKTTLNTIRALDEDDPEYDEKVAEAWTDAGLGGATIPATPDKDAITKLVQEQVNNALKTDREAVVARDAAAETARIRENAQEMATKSGLNMEPGTVDFRLFWDIAQDIPENLIFQPLATQVEWTIDEVRRLKGEVVKTKEQKAAETRRLQAQQSVLEKGPERPVTVATQEPYSINTIVTKQRDARRI